MKGRVSISCGGVEVWTSGEFAFGNHAGSFVSLKPDRDHARTIAHAIGTVGTDMVVTVVTVKTREPWESFRARIRGYIACSCGQTLQTIEQTREHWQRGHFDA